jgi:hypothetical protein
MKDFMLNQIKKAFVRLKRSLLMILKALFIIFVNLAFWLLPLVFMGWIVMSRTLSFVSDFTSSVNPPSGQCSAPVRSGGGLQKFDAAEMLRSAGYLVRESMFWKK